MRASWVSLSSVLLVTFTDLSFLDRLADDSLGSLKIRRRDWDTFDTTEGDSFLLSLSFRAFTGKRGPSIWGYSPSFTFLEFLWQLGGQMNRANLCIYGCWPLSQGTLP